MCPGRYVPSMWYFVLSSSGSDPRSGRGAKTTSLGRVGSVMHTNLTRLSLLPDPGVGMRGRGSGLTSALGSCSASTPAGIVTSKLRGTTGLVFSSSLVSSLVTRQVYLSFCVRVDKIADCARLKYGSTCCCSSRGLRTLARVRKLGVTVLLDDLALSFDETICFRELYGRRNSKIKFFDNRNDTFARWQPPFHVDDEDRSAGFSWMMVSPRDTVQALPGICVSSGGELLLVLLKRCLAAPRDRSRQKIGRNYELLSLPLGLVGYPTLSDPWKFSWRQ